METVISVFTSKWLVASSTITIYGQVGYREQSSDDISRSESFIYYPICGGLRIFVKYSVIYSTLTREL
jgi:hypothetical protein